MGFQIELSLSSNYNNAHVKVESEAKKIYVPPLKYVLHKSITKN